MDEEKSFDYQVNLTIQDIRLLQHCVMKRIELWEGYPKRPAEEQEHLWYLRNSLNRIILDYNYREL